MKETSTAQLVHNATLKIRYAGHIILIGPVLVDKGTLMLAFGMNKTPRVHLTIPIQDITGGVDTVLLTYNYIDHYEPSVSTYLPKEIPFYAQPQDADVIRNNGLTNVILIEEIKTIDGISIYRTIGHHGFGQIGQMMGPVSGYVLKAEDSPIVHITGDRRWEACIRDIAERFSPDYIVVSSGGAIFPEFSKADGPIIPDENEVMQILDELPSHTKLIAAHVDTIDHCQIIRAILHNKATYHEADMSRLIIPEDGEAVVLRVSVLNP